MTRQQLWKSRNRPKAAAHEAVRRAFRAGALDRKPCEVCGHLRVQGHHPNGYDAAHRLDVVWLCAVHHYAIHHRGAGMNECQVGTCSRDAVTDRPGYGEVCEFHAAILDREEPREEEG